MLTETAMMPNFDIFPHFTLAMISIAENHPDFQGKFVGRIFDIRAGIVNPTPFAVVTDTYEELLALKPKNCVIIPRSTDDDPVTKEVWV